MDNFGPRICLKCHKKVERIPTDHGPRLVDPELKWFRQDAKTKHAFVSEQGKLLYGIEVKEGTTGAERGRTIHSGKCTMQNLKGEIND